MSRFILSAACALSLIGPAAFAQTSTGNSMSPAMSNGSAMGTPTTRPDKEQGANAVGTGGSSGNMNNGSGMSKSPAMSSGSAMGTPTTRPNKEQGANAVGTGGSASDNNAMAAPTNGGAGAGMNAPSNGMSKSTGSGMSQ